MTPDVLDRRTSLFSIPGIHCVGCISKLEGGLGRDPAVVEARVNFGLKRLRITHSAAITEDMLREAIGKLGFEAERVEDETSLEVPDERKGLLRALAVAAFASMNVMLLSVSVWAGAGGATRDMFHWLSALIAVPAITYAGRPFFQSAWSAVRRGRTNMDVPISVGIILSTTYSLYETFVGGPQAYFDGALTLIFFLLAGRCLDASMRRRAHDSVIALQKQRPSKALVLSPDGSSRWMAADELVPGMRIIVAAGERSAADGRVEDGLSNIDRSLVTGESAPVLAGAGDEILAGMLNLDGPLTVRITATGRDTALAEIGRLMEAASQARSRYVRIADRVARIYTPAVHTLALLAFLGWLASGAGIHQAIMVAVAVLIITCPCALGLAVPVAQVVAVGALARRGVVVKADSALERLSEADVAIFDKTGTLTLGQPEVIDFPSLAPEDAAALLALARSTRHPLGRALVAILERQGIRQAAATSITEVAGFGVDADFGGRRARLGHPDWIGVSADAGEVPSTLCTAFVFEPSPPVVFYFRDQLRPEVNETLAALRELGMRVLILSGDRSGTVDQVARTLDVESMAEQTPAGKSEAIQALRADGGRPLMIGDGLNDGPALREAHISIAPASASDVGQSAADVLFLGESLMPVARAVRAGRKTMKIVRQNLMFALIYNLFAIPLAFSGVVTPLIAALAMSGSSILVVANSLRLRTAAA
jgi:Cu2+-exporting ATPase